MHDAAEQVSQLSVELLQAKEQLRLRETMVKESSVQLEALNGELQRSESSFTELETKVRPGGSVQWRRRGGGGLLQLPSVRTLNWPYLCLADYGGSDMLRPRL